MRGAAEHARRGAFIGAGAAALLLALGFLLQWPEVTALWPWPGGRLSRIFIASILAAAGVPVLWIGLTAEWAAVAAGAIDFALMYAGSALFAFASFAGADPRPAVLGFGLFGVAMLLLCLALWRWSSQQRFSDPRPMPAPLRWSFAAFAIVLVTTGAALIGRWPHVFPWRLGGAESVLYGWVFLGAACYFVHGWRHPLWKNAQGQLLGFLAYDLVLIGPFVAHFARVDPALRPSLVVYTGVIACSALLALHYLFIDRRTRWGATAA